jgi:DNA polymerase-3 subunit alpha
MGVYLSEHPFAAFADKVAAENTVLCGHVDADLVGQTILVAGMVASVHQSFTRDRRPFASVMLEDLDGRVEVMTWPDVYAGTRELWQEGSILLVEGKVRLRNDRVQLSCDNVRRYQLEAAPEEPPQEEKPPPPPPKSRLTISIKQTENIDNDVACLNKLVDTLRIFPGEDEVNMCVVSGDRIVNLKLSNINTGYCPELKQRLVELVGEEGLRVESC